MDPVSSAGQGRASALVYFMSAPYPVDPAAAPLDPAVARFHRDLSAAVARAAALPHPDDAGRLNLHPLPDLPPAGPFTLPGGRAAEPARSAAIAAGPAGDGPRIAALRRSRVLVPLYCEAYFRNVRCGREWKAFQLASGGGPVVPVLWQPVLSALLPKPAVELAFDHTRFGASYAAQGMRELMRSARGARVYEDTVAAIARAVSAAAGSAPVREGRADIDLDGGPSEFEAPGQVRLLVAAPDGEPIGLGWGTGSEGVAVPLVAQATRMLEAQGYPSVVESFWRPDPPERPARSERPGHAEHDLPAPHPDAVTVLLLDARVLDDEAACAQLAAFVARQGRWPMAVLVPWRPGPGAADDRRRDRLDEVLGPWLGRRKPELRRLPIVVPDPGLFRPTFAQELRRALDQLHAHAAAARTGPGPGRPTGSGLPRLLRRDTGRFPPPG